MNNKFGIPAGIATLALITSCATSIEKNNALMSMSPTEGIQTAQMRLDEARGVQAGVFAKELMEDGEDNLAEAIEELADNDKEDAIEHAAYADAYFQKAINESNKDFSQYKPVLNARQSAINTSLYGVEDLKEKLEDIDEDFIDETDDFTETLSVKEISNFQKRYLRLEADSVVYQNLNGVKRVIENMEDRDADDLAPITFSRAEQSLTVAENLIRNNPKQGSSYHDAVSEAKTDAILLNEVMAVITSVEQDVPEKVALRQVQANRELTDARARLGLYENSLEMAGDALSSQSNKLMSLESKVDFQNALEEIRSRFSQDEAEVYQQGNKLIVRLKEIGFGVGSAEIPKESENLLQKVSSIVRDIDAKNIEVQGHTDTTGSEEINEKLSSERAKRVADYMKTQGIQTSLDSKGYASRNPLTNNLTEDNRRLNRRVDVVITANAPSNELAE